MKYTVNVPKFTKIIEEVAFHYFHLKIVHRRMFDSSIFKCLMFTPIFQVRYKKGDGTLYLMSERLAWILDQKDTVCVSHRYADIKRKIPFCLSINID